MTRLFSLEKIAIEQLTSPFPEEASTLMSLWYSPAEEEEEKEEEDFEEESSRLGVIRFEGVFKVENIFFFFKTENKQNKTGNGSRVSLLRYN